MLGKSMAQESIRYLCDGQSRPLNTMSFLGPAIVFSVQIIFGVRR